MKQPPKINSVYGNPQQNQFMPQPRIDLAQKVSLHKVHITDQNWNSKNVQVPN